MADQRALSTIKGGKVKGQKQVPTVVPDVEETLVREGEKVNRKDYSDEEWQRLVDAGAVTDDPTDLVRPETYKSSDVQAAAKRDARKRRPADVDLDPAPQDETNAENAQSAEDTNKQANEAARKTTEAEREFDLKFRTDPNFKAALLEGFEDQPRQHQAVIANARRDFVAARVEDRDPLVAVGGAKQARKSASTKSEGDKSSGGDNK